MKRGVGCILPGLLALAMGMLACSKPQQSNLPPAPSPLPSPTPPIEEPQIYTPGTYHADAMGNNGRVFVDVELSSAKIEAVHVDTNYETMGIGDTAAAKISETIVAKQTLLIDAVAGATFTSHAVISATQEALSKAGASVEHLLIPPPNIPYNQELAAHSMDVVVVGGGMAGMTAAIRAAEEGATVCLIEQSGLLGGAARYAMGWISGANFRIQQEQGVTEDSTELFYKDILQFAGGEKNIDPTIAHYYAENSGPAIDWLQDVGVKFKNELNVGIYDPMSVLRVAWAENNGASIIQGLQAAIDKYAAEGKITCMLFTEATKLETDGDIVTGVETLDHHGNMRKIYGKSVILATGGFGADMRRLSSLFTNIAIGYITTASGSGYTLAEQAGAAFHNMDYNPVSGGVLPVDGFYSNVRMDVRYEGLVFVNSSGKRVFDELGANYKTRSDAWIHADQNILYGILSESMLDKDKPLLSAGSAWSPTPDNDWSLFQTLAKDSTLVFTADTLEELAEKIGVDSKTFMKTMEKYNQAAASGKDSEFGRKTGLLAFDKGPFYALKTIPYAGRSAGGPVANEKMQVLNKSGAVIPGLYIAGEIVGFSAISGEASISGMYLGEAATFGIAAGKNAAARALAKKR